MKRTIFLSAILVLASCETGGGDQDGDTDANPDVTGDTDDAGDAVDDPGEDAADASDASEGTGECLGNGDCLDDNPCTVDLCDTDTGLCFHQTRDQDGDGYPVAEIAGLVCGGTDCDDTRDDVHPGMPEEGCDWVDNDCDGIAQVMDDDGDEVADVECGGTDCNDDDPFIRPGATEICDMVDDDCDGSWADGGADDDGDGWLDAECGGDDCDDTDLAIYPGAAEVCLDGTDQDCDGVVDGPMPMRPDERITLAPGVSGDPSIAWAGSGFGITWHDDRLGKREIWFAGVDATGVKTTPDVRVTDAVGSSLSPSIVHTGSEFGVAWWDTRSSRDDIYFVKLHDDGSKVGSEVRITDEDGESWYPSVAWTGTGFGMGWFNDRVVGGTEIFYVRIASDGGRDSVDVRITNAVDDSWFPALEWNGSEFGMAWQDSRHGNYEIYFSRFSAEGGLTGSELRITSAAGASQNPSVAWSGSEYLVTWFDRMDGNDEIYAQRVTASAEAIGPLVRVTSDPGLSQHPDVVWTGSEYALGWFDSRSGDLEIWVTRLAADGTKVGTDARITDTYGVSAYPELAWTGTEVGLVWKDERDLDEEIYFNRIGFCD